MPRYRRITVNAVAPPAVETDLIRGVPKAKMHALLARQGIHRFGTPEEVGSVIDFFIDPANDMVTGQTVYLGACDVHRLLERSI